MEILTEVFIDRHMTKKIKISTQESVPLPVYLPNGRKGNYEPEIDKTGHTGPGEFGAAVHTEHSGE